MKENISPQRMMTDYGELIKEKKSQSNKKNNQLKPISIKSLSKNKNNMKMNSVSRTRLSKKHEYL